MLALILFALGASLVANGFLLAAQGVEDIGDAMRATGGLLLIVTLGLWIKGWK